MAISRDTAAASGGAPIIALAVQEQSIAHHEQFRHQREIAAGELMLVDLTAPFAFSWTTTGASRAP